MGYAVTFDYAKWVARYPEFASVAEAQGQLYFDEACLYWRNDGTSPARTEATQRLLLDMLTSHVAALYAQSQNDPQPGAAKDANTPVGRISSATQGSVTVQVEGAPPTEASAFFMQTKYGMSFWRATAVYRTMRYVPGALQQGGLYGVGFPGFTVVRRWGV